ncbi:SixA phosphatase family protein [Succinivibrio sp.]|uniref:SixA phosphatase family protein n=1 Tax=Succinivibrio sp. TaxID=2053619 RepID=UPI0038660ADC
MKIIVIRHGDAIYENADRVLSGQGQEEVGQVGAKLKEFFKATKIYSSPKTRAMQTAAIIADKLDFKDKIEYIPDLTPSGNAHNVISFIDVNCDMYDNVILVSHLPLVEILSYDLNQKITIPPQFGTGCALVMDYNGVRAKYERFVSPYENDYLF